MPTFRHTLPHILPLCTAHQVRRVDAQRGTAQMAHYLARPQPAPESHHTVTMRKQGTRLAFVPPLRVPRAYLAISPVRRAYPYPAQRTAV